MDALHKLPRNVVSGQAMERGLIQGEPLLLCMDGLLRYAKAHKLRFESTLSEDYVLGDPWLAAVKGIRALLNGDGAVAHEKGYNTDSKDNGVIESVFWAAMNAAGFTDENL